jgi:two-component system response regulator (stage 0 sporulation protein F)
MNRRVLIAEDDHYYHNLLLNFFKKFNYEIVPVFNGDSVIELFVESTFDLALINFNLPGKKVEEIMQMVNRELIETPIIITTTDDSIETERVIRSYGPAYLFIKPFSIDNMKKVITQIFSKETAKYK